MEAIIIFFVVIVGAMANAIFGGSDRVRPA